MRRFLALFSAGLVLLAAAAPALAADPEITASTRVLVSVNGDVSLPVGEQADTIVVVDGNANIYGTANNVTVVSGTATLANAHVQTLTIVDGTVDLQAGTRIDGDILQLGGTIQKADGVVVAGAVRSLGESLAALAVFLGFAAIAIWFGAALTLLVTALAVAALAARQVRSAEAVISHEPIKAMLVGLAMLIVPPLVILLLAVSIVGLPLALTILLLAWPALVFLGWLVAAIWIGEWLLRTAGRRQPADRPFLGAVVGVLVAGVAGLIPLVSLVISLFGLGAVTVAGWRTLVGASTPRPTFQPTPQSVGA